MNLDIIIIGFLFVLFSMIIHEIAHGIMALWLGDYTAKNMGRISLNPAKHLDLSLSIFLPIVCILTNSPIIGGAKPVPINKNNLKWGNIGLAVVSLAGPLSNFILSILAISLIVIFNNPIASIYLLFFAKINLGLMIFNLIPIPPLDGSKILYPLAPDFIKGLFDKIEMRGSWIALIIIILFSSEISIFVSFLQSLIINVFMAFLS